MAQLDHGSPSGFKPLMTPPDLENFVKDWQQRAVRMMRAQERMASSMVNAARLEIRYSQELMASRIGLLPWNAAEHIHPSEQASSDFDNFVHVMHDIAEELRSGFTEAAQMLSDTEPHQAAPNGANGSVLPEKGTEMKQADKPEKSAAKPAASPPA